MRVSLTEWLELEDLAMTAAEALKRLDHRLIELACSHAAAGHGDEAALLVRLEHRTAGASNDLYAHGYFVQSEWTGGDSNNPKNYTLREPNHVPAAHRFPAKEVKPLRDRDGRIVILHRCRQPVPHAAMDILGRADQKQLDQQISKLHALESPGREWLTGLLEFLSSLYNALKQR